MVAMGLVPQGVILFEGERFERSLDGVVYVRAGSDLREAPGRALHDHTVHGTCSVRAPSSLFTQCMFV
jgi:hypothetical protein